MTCRHSIRRVSGGAPTSRLQSFETEMLAEDANFAGLASPSRALIAKVEALDSGFRTALEIAYYLGNLWRWLALPKGMNDWSLTILQQRFVETGGQLVNYARY